MLIGKFKITSIRRILGKGKVVAQVEVDVTESPDSQVHLGQPNLSLLITGTDVNWDIDQILTFTIE